MSAVADSVIRGVRRDLERHGDPQIARRRRSAHKGDIPFSGTPVPDIMRAVHSHAGSPSRALRDRQDWEHVVRGLWNGEDSTRESRYAAVALCRMQHYRAHASAPLSTTLYRDLICDHPTRDGVDAVAAHCLPLPLDASPESETPVIRNWALVDSPWLRRASILSQTRRAQVDRDLLRMVVVANLADRRTLIADAVATALYAYAARSATADAAVRAVAASWTGPVSAAVLNALGCASLHDTSPD